MKILLLEPFLTGSHQQWAKGLQASSQYEIHILGLPGRHWKWRMHGGALTLAKMFLGLKWNPDLILATDMLDLSTFLALTRSRLSHTPCILYFHENQLTYPWSPSDQDPNLSRDRHYGFINLSSALSADQVWFNSTYHKNAFINASKKYLMALPDFQEVKSVEQIQKKSSVIPLGLSLSILYPKKIEKKGNPIIVWNHRWEYDKNPDLFFNSLFRLKDEHIKFELIVLGENFQKVPPIFKEAQMKLKEEIIHFGYAESREEYANLLSKADILPVTSKQDFFGISTVEAIYCNCYPILPNRLAFPEHIPNKISNEHLYNSDDEFYQKLKSTVLRIDQIRNGSYQYFVSRYDWCNLSPTYDLAFKKLVRKNNPSHL